MAMATSGKKGKKKAKPVPLQNFLANGNTTQVGVTQVAKKVRNHDDSDDDDHGSVQFYQLPTAPRANRTYEDDNSIPHKPPFMIYITNLAFDTKEEDIYEFFNGYKIETVRLPREDGGDSGRLKGFGYIRFETREDVINAIRLPDPQLKNRRIRIDVSSNENEHRQRNSGNRNRYEGFGNSSENKDSTNWRRGNRESGDRDDDRKSGFHRGYNRDRDREDRPGRDGSAEAGSWRTGDRPNIDNTSPARRNERFTSRRNEDFRKSDNVSRGRPKLNLQPRTLPLPEFTIQPPTSEKDSEAESEKSEQRAPTPEAEPKPPKPTGVPAEKVFGSAKPVDTAAREKEIEERLEREKLEKLKKLEEEKKREKEKEAESEKEVDEKNDEQHTEKDEKNSKNTTSWRKRDEDVKPSFEQRKYSPDRRGPPPRRNDDRRGNNTRDNRDRRDYNRGYDRDNRNMDNRDRNDRNDRDNFNRGGGARDRGFNKDKNIVRGVGDGRDHRDNRHRDEKPKQRDRDSRPERPMPKYQPPQGGQTLSTSNKYAVFQEDDGSD